MGIDTGIHRCPHGIYRHPHRPPSPLTWVNQLLWIHASRHEDEFRSFNGARIDTRPSTFGNVLSLGQSTALNRCGLDVRAFIGVRIDTHPPQHLKALFGGVNCCVNRCVSASPVLSVHERHRQYTCLVLVPGTVQYFSSFSIFFAVTPPPCILLLFPLLTSAATSTRTSWERGARPSSDTPMTRFSTPSRYPPVV